MLNELSINMMENGYDTIYINRIKELADLLYAEWSDYVTVSVSKIKRKRFDSPEAVTESIEKMEDEIVSITKEEFDNTNEYLIKMNLEADCLKVQFISDASTKELKMMIERLAPVEVGLMVKTWGNGGFLEVDFKESQAIISNK